MPRVSRLRPAVRIGKFTCRFVLVAAAVWISLFGATDALAGFISASGSATAISDYFISSSFDSTNETIREEAESYELGEWNAVVESSADLVLGEGRGFGRATVTSDVSGSRFSFHSRLENETAEFSVSGGGDPYDPEHAATAFFTDEGVYSVANSGRAGEFVLTVPTAYSITLETTGITPSFESYGFARLLRLRTTSPFSVPLVIQPIPGDGETVHLNGVLPAGRYLFSAGHTSFTNRTIEFDVLFVIPEPGTAALLGLGLVGLSVVGRRP